MPNRLPIILTGLLPLATASASELDFARDIQPILSDNCYACHGPDEAERSAGLRLDTREGVQTVLSAENLADSEFLYRLTTGDADEVMPPPEHKDPLEAEEIALLKQWVEAGAPWGRHWGFKAPVQTELPRKGHPIDAFVHAGLEGSGLNVSGEAAPETLLRRLSMDLVGLPPSPEELDAFLADDSPQAWNRVITRLLDSPHFGERWARWWMDAARYADSNGYEKDSMRYVWPYRDWVINAFNDNLPYDQFIQRQIAGDLFPEATLEDKVATGFLRNSMVNEEGAIKYEQFRVEGIFDRMDAIGKSILGITTSCAQCHTHKYDPLTHDEYFGLYAFLNNAHEATVPYHTQEARLSIQRVETGVGKVLKQARAAKGGEARLQAWIKQRKAVLESEPEWQVVTPELLGDGGQKFYAREDGSLISQGFSPARSAEKFALSTTMDRIAGLRLELIPDPYLTFGGPGRAIDGTAALSELKLFAGGDPEKLTEVKLRPARADFESAARPTDVEKYPLKDAKAEDDRTEGPAAFATDGDTKTAWVTDAGPDRSNQARTLVADLEKVLLRENKQAPLHLRFELHAQHGGWNSNANQSRNLGRFRFSLTDQAYGEMDPVTPAVAEVLRKPQADWSDAEWETVLSQWVDQDPKSKGFAKRIASLRAQYPVPTPQLVLQERETPRVTRLFHRGEQTDPRHEVKPHVPAFLHPMDPGIGEDPPRLAFAKWLTDPRSPTTARTLVNRTWQAIFGTGIVESVDDFGRQASRPSHPELLDWLAVDFVESGWDFKKLLRRIVTSRTYRRDSALREGDLEVDPRNRLLARGARFRPDAEVVRDTQLAVSGLLDRSVGGDSVRPPIPGFLFLPPVSYGYKSWDEDMAPEKRYRRALYTFRFRTVPPPFLAAFDAPTGEVSCVRRPRSTTPLQALATLNEPLSHEAAVALAGQIQKLKEDESLQSGIRKAFRQCTSRYPSPSELEVLEELHRQEATDPEGDANLAVARVLLNLDETLIKP